MTIRRAALASRRVMRGYTQEALAEYLGVERSTVARWERGMFTPQPWVRPQLAAALAVTTDQLDALLTSRAAGAHPSGGSEHAADSAGRSDSPRFDIVQTQLSVLRRVLDAHDLPDDGPVRSLEQLEQLVGAVVGMRLNSEYTRLVCVLPALLAELNRALNLYQGQRRRAAAQLLAQVYRAADAIADKFGYFDLSARIIALMQLAALASGDELVIAAASYVRAETFFASGNLDAGRRMLELAADRLAPEASTDTAAAYGTLHMRAAVVAARAGHAVRAHEHLDEADRIACRDPKGFTTAPLWVGIGTDPSRYLGS